MIKITEIQKEQNQVQLNIESILRGAPRPSQKKRDLEREDHIQRVYSNRASTELWIFLGKLRINV